MNNKWWVTKLQGYTEEKLVGQEDLKGGKDRLDFKTCL